MHRIYPAFTTYALAVVGVLSAYADRVTHWPAVFAMGLPFGLLLGVDLLLPRSIALVIFAAVGVPLAWFLASMIRVYFVHYRR